MQGNQVNRWWEIGWTPSQRRAILLLLSILLCVLVVQRLRNPTQVADPQQKDAPRATELLTRIDPNSADWRALAAIPNLGEKRAHAIVEYRDHQRATDNGMIVYRAASDLAHVRGIGPATVENLRPYLMFRPETSDTQPDAISR